MSIIVNFFFRKPREGAFSIENVFYSVQEQLKKTIVVRLSYLSHENAGLRNRILLGLEAKKRKGDINHITGDINFIALFLDSKRTILTIHDIESLQRSNPVANYILNLIWLKLPVKKSRSVTVISEQTKKKLLEKVAVAPEKIVVIPNPVAPFFIYKPKVFCKSKPNVLQIGTKYNKNIENTIKALAGINCTLTIIGKLTNKHLLLLAETGTEFLNKAEITNDELLAEYIKADIVSFVSFFEGFGMPIIEANAVGRVVMTSNISAMPEVAGNAALLVDPYNVKQMHEGYLKLIEDDQYRERLINNGVENAKRFSPKNVAQQYLQLYKQML